MDRYERHMWALETVYITVFVTVCLRRRATKGYVAIVVVFVIAVVVVDVVRHLFVLLLLVCGLFE